MTYCPSPLEIPQALPSGFPLGNISLYTPPLVTIQLQSSNAVKVLICMFYLLLFLILKISYFSRNLSLHFGAPLHISPPFKHQFQILSHDSQTGVWSHLEGGGKGGLGGGCRAGVGGVGDSVGAGAGAGVMRTSVSSDGASDGSMAQVTCKQSCQNSSLLSIRNGAFKREVKKLFFNLIFNLWN